MTHNPSEKKSGAAGAGERMPEALGRALRDFGVEELDVRPLLKAGKEPLGTILEVVQRLGPGFAFKLITPFEPLPLFNLLGREGFIHWSEQSSPEEDERWITYFFRDAEESPAGSMADEYFLSGTEDGMLIELDMRGMDPPEPVERVMGVVESMAYGEVLRVVHHCEPLIPFDVLAERGIAYRSKQLGPDEWETKLWRKN